MVKNMVTLNRGPGEAALAVWPWTGGTDITGFGLLGHGWELARASKVGLVIESERVPQLPGAFDYASMGLVPAGSWANQNFCARSLKIAEGVSPVLVNVLADAQTSGGLLLAVPDDRVDGFLAGNPGRRCARGRGDRPGDGGASRNHCGGLSGPATAVSSVPFPRTPFRPAR
jgi:selenide,water dikinase